MRSLLEPVRPGHEGRRAARPDGVEKLGGTAHQDDEGAEPHDDGRQDHGAER
jgi:hypothetical protein